MARRFLRLELATQLFVLLGLLAVMAALAFALARLSLAQSRALDRARTAAGLVSVMLARSEPLGAGFNGNEWDLLMRDPKAQEGSGLNDVEVRVATASPANSPHARFEFMALEALRDPAISEYHEVVGASVLYAARLLPVRCPSGCANPDQATHIRLVRVSAPILGGGAVLPPAVVEYGLLMCAVAGAGVLVLFGWWLRQVVHAARILEGFADRVVNAAPGEPVARVSLVEDEHESANELHRLSLRLRALYRALHQLQSERVPQK